MRSDPLNGDVQLDCIHTQDLTLSSSKESTLGIVKIYISTPGAWVPICLGTDYSGFDQGAAEAVCHQLGYVGAKVVEGQNLYFGHPQSVK